MLSNEDYESLVETVELLSVPGLYESVKEADKQIHEGATYAIDDVFSTIPIA